MTQDKREEAVAKIIDPWSMDRAECDPETEHCRAEALTKARSILSLLTGVPGKEDLSSASQYPEPIEPRGALPANDLANARRILNDVYWKPIREATGDDFEDLNDALDSLADVLDAARCFLTQRDTIAHVTDLDAWTRRVEATVNHLRAMCEAAEGRS